MNIGLGLLDYPDVVKNPMDLSTVKVKLDNQSYKYVEEFLEEIQLIWDNCKLFNAEKSVIFLPILYYIILLN